MERKLRLVPPPAAEHGHEADPGEETPSAAEHAEAEALRDALDRGEDLLAADLRAAFKPQAIADADLDALVARALGDESAATQAEREAADRLRAELAGEAAVEEAAILDQLRVAAKPRALDPAKNEALIEAALARMDARTTRPNEKRPARRGVVRRIAPVTMAALAGVTALAAGFALFFGQMKSDAPGAAASAALIRARSTQDLFDAATPFPRSGEESARIDRIAAARTSDLRANRFAAWGVR
ncbi:MAG: hypothetical protein QM820_37895 [Minicystis sp.]